MNSHDFFNLLEKFLAETAGLPFKFIFYKEDDRWVGHCLETDTVVEGMSPREAVRNLKDALELQIEDALKRKNISLIFNPAPKEFWRLLPQAIPMTHIRR